MNELAVITVAAYRHAKELHEQIWPLEESYMRVRGTATEDDVVRLWVTQAGMLWCDFYRNKVVQLVEDLKNLNNPSLRPPKYLLYCDASDTMLLRDPREVITILKDYGRPILLGAEAVCWPWPKRHGRQFSLQPSDLHYPQAGVWAGEYDAVVAELEKIVRMVVEDREHYTEGKAAFGFQNEDQCCWIERILRGDPIAFDTEARLVANMNSAPAGQFELTDEGVYCPKTGQRPVVLHWAGGPKSKESLRAYARRLRKEVVSHVPRTQHDAIPDERVGPAALQPRP